MQGYIHGETIYFTPLPQVYVSGPLLLSALTLDLYLLSPCDRGFIYFFHTKTVILPL